jgi:DNA topoisomerase-1
LAIAVLASVQMANEVASDSVVAAETAGLRYASDLEPGIRRVRQGRGFAYLGRGGRRMRDRVALRRIKRLAIPPAWTDVWICASASGHIQATGRDSRGRKQYRYHERWRDVRDEAKYERLADFARALPKIRARVAADLARPDVPREKVLATAVRLLEETMIRVGNAEYAKANGSFGLTTLRARHVDVRGARLVFRFRGKSGKEHEVDVRDQRLARVVARLEQLPGQQLFRYVDAEGAVRPVGSDDVNEYLRAISGEDLTAKDFRTWAGTVLAAQALAKMRPTRNERLAKRRVLEAVDVVAKRLGNTRAVCRRCYVHPAVIEAFMEGALPVALSRADRVRRARGLSNHEAAVARVLARAARGSVRRAA